LKLKYQDPTIPILKNYSNKAFLILEAIAQ
jgi:hypothetical protein